MVGCSALVIFCPPAPTPAVVIGDSHSGDSDGCCGTKATLRGVDDKDFVAEGSVNGVENEGEKAVVSEWKRRYRLLCSCSAITKAFALTTSVLEKLETTVAFIST